MTHAPKGVYNAVLPLDVLILRGLPKEGALFMGVYPEGDSVHDVKKRIGDGKLPSAMISTRLRILHMYGYVTTVKIPRSSTSGWQITPKGTKLVSEHEAGDGNPT